MPYEAAADPERTMKRWAPFAVFGFGAILISFVVFKEPTGPPSNGAAFGCYISNNRPPIRINASGVQVMDAKTPVVPFRLEWHDEGITLWPENRFILVDRPEGGSFQVEDKPGQAITFVTVVDSAVYPDVDAANLNAFQFFTSEGIRAGYSRTASEACAAPL